MARQRDVDAVPGLGDLKGLLCSIGKQIGTGDCTGKFVEEEATIGPGKDLNIDAIGGGSRAPVPFRNKLRVSFFIFFSSAEIACFGAEERGVSAIDRFTV